MRKCSTCKEEKPLSGFYRDRSRWSGYRGQCKSCVDKRSAEYVSRNPDRTKNRKRLWQKGYRIRRGSTDFNYRYGITVSERDRLYREQSGLCAICGKPYSILSVDHDHKTGLVRGLLCKRCNSGIGMLGDDLAGVEKAFLYLKKHLPATWETA